MRRNFTRFTVVIVIIIVVLVIPFCVCDLREINELNDRILFLDVWFQGVSCVLAIVAALIAWKEYRGTHRPVIWVSLCRRSVFRDGQYDSEGIVLLLRNDGSMPASNVSISFSPGVPWPLGSRPAGENQNELRKKTVSYLGIGDCVTLLFAERISFNKSIVNAGHSIQTVTIQYSRPGEYGCYRYEFKLDLSDSNYIAEDRIDVQGCGGYVSTQGIIRS